MDEHHDGIPADSAIPRYLLAVVWMVSGLVVISFAIYAGSYFARIGKFVIVKRVHEPPPLVGTRNVLVVLGPQFPEGYAKLYRPLYEIDKKWLRPKWWTEVSPDVQAALGVSAMTQNSNSHPSPNVPLLFLKD